METRTPTENQWRASSLDNRRFGIKACESPALSWRGTLWHMPPPQREHEKSHSRCFDSSHMLEYKSTSGTPTCFQTLPAICQIFQHSYIYPHSCGPEPLPTDTPIQILYPTLLYILNSVLDSLSTPCHSHLLCRTSLPRNCRCISPSPNKPPTLNRLCNAFLCPVFLLSFPTLQTPRITLTWYPKLLPLPGRTLNHYSHYNPPRRHPMVCTLGMPHVIVNNSLALCL